MLWNHQHSAILLRFIVRTFAREGLPRLFGRIRTTDPAWLLINANNCPGFLRFFFVPPSSPATLVFPSLKVRIQWHIARLGSTFSQCCSIPIHYPHTLAIQPKVKHGTSYHRHPSSICCLESPSSSHKDPSFGLRCCFIWVKNLPWFFEVDMPSLLRRLERVVQIV